MQLQSGWRLGQLFFFILATGLALSGQPSTTRISDTIYLANGEKFNGYVQIEWQSFVTPKAPVAPYSSLHRVIDGILDVHLISTKNSGNTAYYRVRYFRNGRVQFAEFWDVPASTATLNISSVRLVSPPEPGQSGTPGSGIDLPLPQEDVEGLPSDLADRPVKGPNYFPSRTVYANPDGALEAIAGSPTDCVRVDGTAAPCGSGDSALYRVEGEAPSGVLSGVNQIFTLSSIPGPPESLQLYRNGVLQKRGLDYTLSGAVITFALLEMPQPGDILLAYYRTFQGSTPPAGSSGSLPQVVCSLPGSSTNALTLTALGSCLVGSSMLQAGDRLEIQFDFALTGSVSDGYEVQLDWNGTPILARSFVAGDATSSHQAKIVIGTATRQYSTTSVGQVSVLQAGTGSLPLPGGTFPVEIRGRVSTNPSAQLTLTSYSITRFPRVIVP
ncbi:MAG: hypothetical protein IT169_09675 [Bryobacterales bacterium]|nr:hypothetical protein [Bryobacterales bacterium]